MLALSPAECAAVQETVVRRLRQIREQNAADTADEARVLALILEYAARGMAREISEQFPVPRAHRFPTSAGAVEIDASLSRFRGAHEVSVREAARRLGLMEQSGGRRVRQLIASHELDGEMVDGRWMVDERSLDALIAKRKRHR